MSDHGRLGRTREISGENQKRKPGSGWKSESIASPSLNEAHDKARVEERNQGNGLIMDSVIAATSRSAVKLENHTKLVAHSVKGSFSISL